MKIFANENLFEPIIDYLRSLGNDVLSIRDCGLSGISDDEVYEKACKENMVIITPEGVRIRRSTRWTNNFPPYPCYPNPCRKQKDPDADTSALERQIDQMVYTRYDLTPEEIAIVEG